MTRQKFSRFMWGLLLAVLAVALDRLKVKQRVFRANYT